MGDGGDGDRDADRSAVGASIGGDLGGVKYGVAWRRLGEDFDSGLGRTGTAGTHAITGRMGWSLPLEGMPFLKSWEFGVRTRFDTDLQLESRSIDREAGGGLQARRAGGDLKKSSSGCFHCVTPRFSSKK